MEPLLILFDVDGTLVDTAGAGRRAMEQAFREVFGVDFRNRHSPGVRFAGLTDWRIIEALTEAAGIEADWHGSEMDRLRATYLHELAAEMGRPDPRRRVLPGVRALLDHLAGRDEVFLGLLTGNLEAGARIKLEPFGLNRYFPAGGFGSEHRDRRVLAQAVCRRLSERNGIAFSGSGVVVIGDTEHDVECAKANGFRAVAVMSGWASRETLASSQPDALFADLSDLPRVLDALGAAGP